MVKEVEEKDLGEQGLKITMVTVLTDTKNQHKRGYSYGSGWGAAGKSREKGMGIAKHRFWEQRKERVRREPKT